MNTAPYSFKPSTLVQECVHLEEGVPFSNLHKDSAGILQEGNSGRSVWNKWWGQIIKDISLYIDCLMEMCSFDDSGDYGYDVTLHWN